MSISEILGLALFANESSTMLEVPLTPLSSVAPSSVVVAKSVPGRAVSACPSASKNGATSPSDDTLFLFSPTSPTGRGSFFGCVGNCLTISVGGATFFSREGSTLRSFLGFLPGEREDELGSEVERGGAGFGGYLGLRFGEGWKGWEVGGGSLVRRERW